MHRNEAFAFQYRYLSAPEELGTLTNYYGQFLTAHVDQFYKILSLYFLKHELFSYWFSSE